MNLETRKLSFIQEFLRIQNEEIITGLENLLRIKKSELSDMNQKPMSLEQFNAEIDESIKDSDAGYLIKATDLKEKIQSWR